MNRGCLILFLLVDAVIFAAILIYFLAVRKVEVPVEPEAAPAAIEEPAQ